MIFLRSNLYAFWILAKIILCNSDETAQQKYVKLYSNEGHCVGKCVDLHIHVHIHRKFWFVFCFGVMPLFELWNWPKWKMLLKTTTEIAQQNFVELSELWSTSCVAMHFYRKCWFDLFKEQFISFLNFGQNYILCNSDETCFLSLMLGIAICCIQHSQAMLERGVCELAHSFFHFKIPNISTNLR